MPQEKKGTVTANSRRDETDAILDRVARETETVGTSSFTRTADHLRKHLGAHDADQNQWTEVWGTRIGRVLGILFFIGLVVYLLHTYVLHG